MKHNLKTLCYAFWVCAFIGALCLGSLPSLAQSTLDAEISDDGYIQPEDFDVFEGDPPQMEESEASSFDENSQENDEQVEAESSEPTLVAEVNIVNQIGSLFFTANEHEQILKSKNARGFVRPPSQSELENGVTREVKPGERTISLGGIVYRSKKDWMIWINSRRITPDALPKEALELRVFEDYIEVRWYDEYTNKIYPIRLRAHQRFNMDTRIFLPG